MEFNKNFVKPFLVSLVSFLMILAFGLATVWYSRANIFGYFAKEYLQSGPKSDGKPDVEKIITEKIIEKESIFTQEYFIVNAVEKSNPAVVSIIVSKEVPKYETFIDPNAKQNPFGELFPDFFFNIPQYRQRQNGTEKKEIGGGSGFFVSSDGLIVTNKHVVSEENVEYTVFTNDEKKHIAKVIARDPILDIAIIKIESVKPGSKFPNLPLGNSDSLKPGQSVIAIGNALGEFHNTVSVGVISGLSRSILAGSSMGRFELLDHVIQTDAAINPGNSGGPLLNLDGQVVGVNVAVAQGSQNIGFALPINSVKSVVESVKATGKIIRPFLGVRYIAINKILKEQNNLTFDYGVLVKGGSSQNELAVIPGSPAHKAGVVENDIILEINGTKLDDKTSLVSIIRHKKVGDTINLKILHKGIEKTLKATLTAAPE
jgi:serine protease Do